MLMTQSTNVLPVLSVLPVQSQYELEYIIALFHDFDDISFAYKKVQITFMYISFSCDSIY